MYTCAIKTVVSMRNEDESFQLSASDAKDVNSQYGVPYVVFYW